MIRRWINFLTILSLVWLTGLAGCRSEAERRLAISVRRELQQAETAANGWVRSAGDSLPAAVATGYLERLRLGFGSPFRLVDLARHDPRLDNSTRNSLAWALLQKLMAGHAYVIDPVVLDRAGTIGALVWPGVGRAHSALIQKTIDDADSVRAAELGLRLGYSMAVSERLVSPDAPLLVGQVAALLTDRALARADAERLLQAALDYSGNALDLLQNWREGRRFAVERPRIGPLPNELEVQAIAIAQQVLGELRKVGLEVVAHGHTAESRSSANTSLLTLGGANELRAAEAALDLPPVTPIVIAARQLSRETVQMTELTDEQRRLRQRFSAVAVNEESFVAEYARLTAESDHDAAPARAQLQAAIALRAYAQERIWFPGMPAPGSRDLEERYGLAAVTFDQTVSAAWRPYYRRMLAYALDDLFRVMPGLRLNGLRVQFGPTPETEDALAMHDPRARKLVLPAATGAGTIAHEVAHDIDWQMSLRRYRVRGDYATDRAMRRNDDALATQIRNLTSALLAAPDARMTVHTRRPAEVFARNVDWYVAVSLARDGRRNGYLSSVQDELITGYGTVRPPDVSGAAGDALMSILAELAPVYREQRDGFRALYGSNRLPRAYDLVRRVNEANSEQWLAPTLAAELGALQNRRAEVLGLINGGSCDLAMLAGGSTLQKARRELVITATAARARGAALRYAEHWLGRRGRDLMLQQLYGGPLPVSTSDSITTSMATTIAAEVAQAAPLAAAERSPFQLTQPAQCAGPARF